MIIDSTEILAARRFRVVRIRERIGERETSREVVRHPGAVTILPVFDDGRVCLIRNYRVAVDEELIELPAGTLEPDEDPRTTAERELIEETGYRAAKWEKLHEFFLSPGILDERMHVYVATQLTGGSPARELGEQIENLIVPFDEAMQMVEDGRIHDAKTMVALLLYGRRQRL